MTTRTCTVRAHQRRLPAKPPIYYERLRELEIAASDNRLLWEMEQALAEIARTDMLAMMGEVQ